MYKAA